MRYAAASKIPLPLVVAIGELDERNLAGADRGGVRHGDPGSREPNFHVYGCRGLRLDVDDGDPVGIVIVQARLVEIDRVKGAAHAAGELPCRRAAERNPGVEQLGIEGPRAEVEHRVLCGVILARAFAVLGTERCGAVAVAVVTRAGDGEVLTHAAHARQHHRSRSAQQRTVSQGSQTKQARRC